MGIELVVLTLLQAKHFLGDFVLQTENQALNKGTYGHPAGLIHAAIHAILSVPCLLIVGIEPLAVILAAAVELTIHYHQDWLKERVSKRFAGSTKVYWVVFGADQLLHQLFYVALIVILL